MVGGKLFEATLARDDDTYRSTDRGFGLTFAAIGFAFGIAKLWWGEGAGWFWLAGGGVLLALAVISPQVLAPLNRLWGRLAVVVHKFATPVVMLVVFVTTVVPIGLIMRLLGKDPLKLKSRSSGWDLLDRPTPARPSARHNEEPVLIGPVRCLPCENFWFFSSRVRNFGYFR